MATRFTRSTGDCERLRVVRLRLDAPRRVVFRADDFRAEDFRAEDFRPDFRAEDLRADDLRADDLRPEDLRAEERFFPPDFRALDLRPDLRALDLRPVDFFPREPPRDDFLAAMPVLHVGGSGAWISKIRAQCRHYGVCGCHWRYEKDSPGRNIAQFSRENPASLQAVSNRAGGSSAGSSVRTNVPQWEGTKTQRWFAFTR